MEQAHDVDKGGLRGKGSNIGKGKKNTALKAQSCDTILKKNKVGGLTLSEFKACYKAAVIKALYWQNSKEINRTEKRP